MPSGAPWERQLTGCANQNGLFENQDLSSQRKWNWQSSFHGPKRMNHLDCNDLVDLLYLAPYILVSSEVWSP